MKRGFPNSKYPARDCTDCAIGAYAWDRSFTPRLLGGSCTCPNHECVRREHSLIARPLLCATCPHRTEMRTRNDALLVCAIKVRQCNNTDRNPALLSRNVTLQCTYSLNYIGGQSSRVLGRLRRRRCAPRSTTTLQRISDSAIMNRRAKWDISQSFWDISQM